MTEVAERNGQAVVEQDKAVKLQELAERINGKHRARDAAVKTALGQLSAALDNALDAGSLLLEAKDLCPQGTFEDWIRANCKVSVRRAQEYMFLAGGREELEEAKARGSAFSSIDNALEFLRMAKLVANGLLLEDKKPMQGPPIPGFRSELPIETKARRATERAQQKLLRKAEFALRTGSLNRPADLTAWEQKNWRTALHKAMDARTENLPNVVDNLGHQLHILSMHADPEAVGRYLVEPRNDPDEAEARSAMLAEYRAGADWLQRVLAAAEQEQG